MSNFCPIVCAQPSSRRNLPRDILKGGEGDRRAAAAAHWSDPGYLPAAGIVWERSGQFDRLPLLACVSVLALLVTGTGAGARQLGGATSVSATTAVSQAAQSVSQQAAAIAKQGQASMLRAVQALQAMQAAQATARSLAANGANSLGATLPAVTDGLTPGGLVVDPRVLAGTDPSLWLNAGGPVATTASNGQTAVTITQTAQRAVMTWQQFNVGRNTTLYFDQSAGNSTTGNSWVALNRIDASGVPSQILGKIKAEGQVLIINPNGIIFGAGSQINIHSLIASTLDVNTSGVNVFGTTGNYVPIIINGVAQKTPSGSALLGPVNEDSGNQGFLTSGLFTGAAATPATATFSQGRTSSTNGTPAGSIMVQPGALISTDVSGFDNGGMVALIGASVTNAGQIQVKAGDVILAAASQLTITEPSTGTTPFTVGLGATTWGTAVPGSAVVTNAAPLFDASGAIVTPGGVITSARGEVTMAADTVYQMGIVEATTSITRAGSITITTTVSTKAGQPYFVVFGPGSITSIVPDENGETITSDDPSLANFTAPNITVNSAFADLQGGAMIVAPGAAVNFIGGIASQTDASVSAFGRVLLEPGAVIDVGGLSNVPGSVADTLFTFKVTANDVADTPLARALIGRTVTIDLSKTGTRADGEIWHGSPLFAATSSGYFTGLHKNIDQLLTKGGTVNANNYVDVLQSPGSIINISGGSIAYTGGTVSTTRVIGSDGRRYDIGSATLADVPLAYTIDGGFTVNHPHWNLTEIYASSYSYYKPGFTMGFNAGALAISASNPVLEGRLLGDVLIGEQQRQAATELPKGGALTISLIGPAFSSVGSGTGTVVLDSSANTPDVLGANFNLSSTLTLPTVTLPNSSTVGSVYRFATDMLSAANLRSISISGAAAVSMPKGASLSVRPGGTISLGNVVSIDGTLQAPSGTISITGYSTATIVGSIVLIGPDAILDAAGRWVNDTGLSADLAQGAAYIDGGTVTISAPARSLSSAGHHVDVTSSIVLAPGSVIDVSSGGYVSQTGKLQLDKSGLPSGKGGSVSLGVATGGWSLDSSNGIPSNYRPDITNPASIVLGGSIYGEGFSSGATLSLMTGTIVIDQSNGVDNSTSPTTYVSQATAASIKAATGVVIPAAQVSDSLSGTMVMPVSFFRNNAFSKYVLTSTYGSTTLTRNTTLTLRQSNYTVAGGSGTQILTGLPTIGTGVAGGGLGSSILPWSLQPTGARLRDFASIAVAPDGLRHQVDLTLVEQGLPSTTSASANSAGVLIDQGAAIVADPLAAISLQANGPVTVLGSLTAHGGQISLLNDGSFYTGNGAASDGHTLASTDVWIGSSAVLDVSGTFVPNPRVSYTTGKVLQGGTITLSSATGAVIVAPGSMLNLQGGEADIQAPGAGGGARPGSLVPQTVWSDGGSLILSGGRMFFDGTVKAAGGSPLAMGGTLTIGNTAVIAQSGSMTSYLVTSSLPTGGYPATKADFNALLAKVNPLLGVDTSNAQQTATLITADTLNNSGFGTVNLTGTTVFSGNVTIGGPKFLNLSSLTLNKAGDINPTRTYSSTTPSTIFTCAAPTCTTAMASIGGTTVELDAGYIRLLNPSTIKTSSTSLADGTLILHATSELDLGSAAIRNAADVRLISDGDIRLIASVPGTTGAFVVSDSLTLTARQIYPTTGTTFLLQSTGAADPGIKDTRANPPTTQNTIEFKPGGAPSAKPLSAGGQILVDAKTIVQGGNLVAPLGVIQLGFRSGQALPSLFSNLSAVVTQSLTLANGSSTSVSASGLVIPYGSTVDGQNWWVNGSLLTTPPAKKIVLAGNNVEQDAGAKIDESGGGDIYATESVLGTGGSRNVLTADASTVYAIVPGYSAPVAAWDPTFNTSIGTGSAVYLSGGNGLAAGWYTLLPGMYATLPGAYRVTVQTSSTQLALGTALTQADQSQLVTGYVGNAISGSRSSQVSLFKVQSQAVWSQSSQINITSGNSFFAQAAVAAGNAVPPLPMDAGQLQIAATTSLNLYGGAADFNFVPAAGGAGALVDITGTNIAVLSNAAQAVPAGDTGYLTLYANQLAGIGATSVLIGGTRTAISSGIMITAAALNLDVATPQDALTAPELLLVTLAPTTAGAANGLTIRSGSRIMAQGSVPVAGEVSITIGHVNTGTSTGTNDTIPESSGDGSLLRVSNGTIVTVTRAANVPAAPLGSLTVNAGATISGKALTLDSSGSNSLSPSAILKAADYDLSGSVINLGDTSGSATNPGGLILSAANLANFDGANSVQLRSASVINLYDAITARNPNGLQIGNSANPIGTLTFDSAGLYSQGGSSTINATNITLINSKTVKGVGMGGQGGTLTLTATANITADSGDKSLGGFSTINWNAGQAIRFSGSGSIDAGPAATAALMFGVGSVAVTNSGFGYSSVPTVTVTGTGGTGASATASLGVVSIAVTSGGSGYVNGAPVTVTGPGGSGFTGTAIVSNGAITGVNVTSMGAGYTGAITSVTVGGAGTGATFATSLGVVGVSVTPGSGYTAIPTLSFSGGGGTGAAAQTLASVTGISLTGPGDGYVGVPTVTIAGGGGSGTTATATIAGNLVNGVTLTNLGTGYTSMPTVTFSGGASPANITLSAPMIVAAAGSTQKLSTGGTITLSPRTGTAPNVAATEVGGSLTLIAKGKDANGYGIVDNATITAKAGTVKLEAVTGDVVVGASALIDAAGTSIAIGGAQSDQPGGTVSLVSDAGNVKFLGGGTIDVSAAGIGYAGSVNISAAGAATLAGTFKAAAQFTDIGGNFTLTAGSLDASTPLPFTSGFSRSFSTTLSRGDIVIGSGTVLTSGHVLLVAETGNVKVAGTIDASGPSGGDIALYGAGGGAGVTSDDGKITVSGILIDAKAQLIARYKAPDRADPAYANGTSTLVANGGTITLGTVGTWDGKTLNTDGSENISSSGRIYVASKATADVSGGTGGSGGSIIVRAPIVGDRGGTMGGGKETDGSSWSAIRVSFNATPTGTGTSNGVVLRAFETWTTAADPTKIDATKRFDGLIDPAGWYNADGTRVVGTLNNYWVNFAVTAPGNYTSVQTLTACTASATTGCSTSLLTAVMNAAGTKTFTAGTGYTAGTFTNCTGTTTITCGSGTNTVTATLTTTTGGTIAAGSGIAISQIVISSTGLASTSAITFSSLGSGYTAPVLVTVKQGTNSSTKETLNLAIAGVTAPGGISAVPFSIKVGSTVVATASLSAIQSAGTQATNSIPYTGVGSIFTPTTAYSNHTTFYQTTLAGFVQDPFQASTNTTTGPAQTIAQDSFAGVTSNLHLQPEISLINPDASKNGGNITVLTNWNLGGGAFATVNSKSVFVPIMRTGTVTMRTDTSGAKYYDLGEPGALRLAAVNNVAMQASITDGFYETKEAFVAYSDTGAKATLVANFLAPYQQFAGTLTDGTTKVFDFSPIAAANLMSVTSGINVGSFSYDFVTGARLPSALQSPNPDAIAPVSAQTITVGASASASFTINGHISYLNSQEYNNTTLAGTPLTVYVPNLLRTGTGSITIMSAGSVEFLDPLAPGAIYTAGAVAPNAAGFTPPAVPAAPVYATSATGTKTVLLPNGLVSTPTWASGGGNVTITAMDSIVGIESPVDDGTQTWVANGLSSVGMPTGQFWSAWYYHDAVFSTNASAPFAGGVQPASWINYATFFQGVGALGGGNVALRAGNNITDVSASIPETVQVSAGQTIGSAPVAHYYGGGNLLVEAGQNIYSGLFYVGRGSGLIRAGGTVAVDSSNPITGLKTQIQSVSTGSSSGVSLVTVGTTAITALPLMLAVQDGFITVNARQSVNLGGVYDPTTLYPDVGFRTRPGALPTSVVNASGFIGASIIQMPTDMATVFDTLGPTSGISINSASGSVVLNLLGQDGRNQFYHSGISTANASVGTVAPSVLDVSAPLSDITTSNFMELAPSPSGNLELVAGGTITLKMKMLDTVSIAGLGAFPTVAFNTVAGARPTTATFPIHVDDTSLVQVEAGTDVSGFLDLNKPGLVQAGRDVKNLLFLGENNSDADITAIMAGRDILGTGTPTTTGTGVVSAAFALYGPGTFLLQAGRNIGPVNAGNFSTANGIMTVGDGSNSGGVYNIRPYLPRHGADLFTLFGVGPGVNYQGAITQYIDPANAGANGVDFRPLIAQQLDQQFDAEFQTLAAALRIGALDLSQFNAFNGSLAAAGLDIVTVGNLADRKFVPSFAVKTDAVWAYFQTLSTLQRNMVIQRSFLDFLTKVGTDYYDATSPYAGQYSRAYQAIATMFPAAYGYTANAADETRIPSAKVPHGNMYLAYSLLETQTGGDINIIGPGGNILVGSNGTDPMTPNQEGILTLQGGSIRGFVDGSILVAQSRIFTEQGGNVELFSANGDLNAGKGPKSKVAYPKLKLLCDIDGYCRVSPAGLVTGAGIAALVSVPGQDLADSNSTLTAPHGVIDPGSAGIRVAGKLVVSPYVVNAFNIDVGGKAVGLPTVQAPPIGALLSGNSQTAGTKQASPASTDSGKQTSVIIVEVLGFGGSGTDAPADNSNGNSGGAGAPKRNGSDKCNSGEECRL